MHMKHGLCTSLLSDPLLALCLLGSYGMEIYKDQMQVTRDEQKVGSTDSRMAPPPVM